MITIIWRQVQSFFTLKKNLRKKNKQFNKFLSVTVLSDMNSQNFPLKIIIKNLQIKTGIEFNLLYQLENFPLASPYQPSMWENSDEAIHKQNIKIGTHQYDKNCFSVHNCRLGDQVIRSEVGKEENCNVKKGR